MNVFVLCARATPHNTKNQIEAIPTVSLQDIRIPVGTWALVAKIRTPVVRHGDSGDARYDRRVVSISWS